MDRKTIEKDLKSFVAALKAEGIAVDKLFPYGSYAHGGAVQGSDIDASRFASEIAGRGLEIRV